MAKKKIIHLDFEAPGSVIGLASNEKVWKLAWKINQVLGLTMATEEEGFARLEGPELYQDLSTDADFEYVLFENGFKAPKVSKLAQQFRFWLLIRHKREVKPDVEGICKQLGAIDIVSLVRDLTHEKDIQKLLP